MPELPEVETVCRLMRNTLLDQTISEAIATTDDIVFKGIAPEQIQTQIQGRKVTQIGRKGKYFWLEFESPPSLIGHLGMSGWVEHLEAGQETPRFAKLRLNTLHKGSIVITDKRRLGRLWLSPDPRTDKTILELGLDAYDELPANPEFHQLLVKRKAPIKAILLDQKLFSGIGNYLADEVLYHAGIAPIRGANSLSDAETKKLHQALTEVIGTAVDLGANEERFPESWLFHHRWGGKKGAETIGGHKIVRETVGGRTSAWVPDLQK